MGKLSPNTTNHLKNLIDNVTRKKDGAPGLVVVAVDRNGDTLFEHASGKRGLDSAEPMTTDTVFWIASCTKMIVSIAAMQLVEQGKLALDDVELVERICPELKEVKVLQEDSNGNLKLVEKERGITLRMLLSHTAGFGYSVFNSKLNRWYGAIGLDEFSGLPRDILTQPLVNQPGSKWEYGVNIDWAGELIMRVTGLSLEEYLQKHVFAPLGIKDVTMFPSADMKRRLAYLHQRGGDGVMRRREDAHPMKLALRAEKPEDEKGIYNTGGAGCFAVPSEFSKLLTTLLNNGKCPKTGTQILKPSSVEELFTNQIPEFPNFARPGLVPVKFSFANPGDALYPQPLDQAQGWTLAGFYHVHGTATGRAPRTIFWAGIANLFWWVDREKGVAGFVASQILPFGDPDVLTLSAEVEVALYSDIGKSSRTSNI